jgi:hypothetical protein
MRRTCCLLPKIRPSTRHYESPCPPMERNERSRRLKSSSQGGSPRPKKGGYALETPPASEAATFSSLQRGLPAPPGAREGPQVLRRRLDHPARTEPAVLRQQAEQHRPARVRTTRPAGSNSIGEGLVKPRRTGQQDRSEACNTPDAQREMSRADGGFGRSTSDHRGCTPQPAV